MSKIKPDLKSAVSQRAAILDGISCACDWLAGCAKDESLEQWRARSMARFASKGHPRHDVPAWQTGFDEMLAAALESGSPEEVNGDKNGHSLIPASQSAPLTENEHQRRFAELTLAVRDSMQTCLTFMQSSYTDVHVNEQADVEDRPPLMLDSFETESLLRLSVVTSQLLLLQAERQTFGR